MELVSAKHTFVAPTLEAFKYKAAKFSSVHKAMHSTQISLLVACFGTCSAGMAA